MVGLTNAVPVKNVLAVLDVTYTAGASCTAQDVSSGKTLSAAGTSGNFTFLLPNPGIWKVTIKLGQSEVYKTVSVDYFERKSLKIAFPVYLYKDGVELDSWGVQDSKTSKGETSINININNSNTLAYYSEESKFSVTPEFSFAHAKFHVNSHNNTQSNLFAALFLRETVPNMENIDKTGPNLVASMGSTWTNGNDYTVDLDISSMTGQELYVLFGARYTCNIDMLKVWFD